VERGIQALGFDIQCGEYRAAKKRRVMQTKIPRRPTNVSHFVSITGFGEREVCGILIYAAGRQLELCAYFLGNVVITFEKNEIQPASF
jgi:hypothetical protein